MSSWLTRVGADALVLFWWPLLLWTAAGLALVGLLRLLPERYAREQYELRTALLAALPVGIVLAAVFRALSAEPLIVLTLPYEIVVRANGTATTEMIDLSSIAGVSTGSLLLAFGAVLVAILGLAHLVADLGALRRMRGTLHEITEPGALDLLGEARRENGIAQSIRLVSSDAIGTPAAFGWMRPTVLVPSDLLERPEELRLVLLHETAHLARGDFALDTVSRVVFTLFGWHPLVGHVFRTRAYWREAACDLAVLNASHVDRLVYARLLLAVSVGDSTLRPALVTSMTASPGQLTRRIEAMTRIHDPNTTRPVVRHVLTAIMLAVVVTFTACSDSTPAAVETPSEATAPGARTAGKDAAMMVDEMPEVEGGLSALGQQIVYPEDAKRNGIEGRVLISFVVEKDGTVSKAEIVQGVDESLDREALRVVRDLTFKPAIKDGEPVWVQMTLPISFKLK